MDFERAKKITADCMAHVWYREGLTEEPGPDLHQYTLAEMVEANNLVSANKGVRQPDGNIKVFMCCADRLVAALYVATHYVPDRPDDVNPVAVIGKSAVCVIRCDKPTEEQE